jgi:hypothetical protein
MKSLVFLLLGFIVTLVAIDLWAGTYTPVYTPKERLVMDATFYQQPVQLKGVLQRIKAEPAPKIIALGDSTLYGALVYENETIPYLLGHRLQTLQHPNAKVYNLAYPGARPADLYAMLKWVRPVDPDLVIIDVNVVFYSKGILEESALANPSLRSQFIYEPDVPKGLFQENRVEAAVQTWVRETNIGINKSAIQAALFKQAPRGYIRDWLSTLLPPVASPPPVLALPRRDVIGMGWKDKAWGPPERKTMERIYGRGELDALNDSVKMLHRTIQYSKKHGMNVLFYMAPQNETLIGRFFSLDELHHNQQFIRHILQEEQAWFVDLSQTVPEDEFGDYDHMLKKGHIRVAEALHAAIAAKGEAVK